MAATSAPAQRFSGFSDDAIQFLLELQAEQSRTWFKAHQADFVNLCRQPLELYINDLRDRLVKDYPGVVDVEPHIFRIQRDTRFSKDKLPYKTNLAAELRVRDSPPDEEEHAVPGLYVSFGLDGEYLGMGCWHMAPEALTRYRAAVDASGAELQRAVDKLVRRGWTIESIETLKRVPPPYAQDHPQGELLRRKGLAMMIRPPEGLSARAEFVDWSAERLREVKPVVNWLERALHG